MKVFIGYWLGWISASAVFIIVVSDFGLFSVWGFMLASVTMTAAVIATPSIK